MGYYDRMKEDLDMIYHALSDEESRDWFDARVEYMVSGEQDLFWKSIFKLGKKYPKDWRHLGLERFNKGTRYEGIIVYGCGHDGKIVKEILNLCGYKVDYWCDSNRQMAGNFINEVKVISPEELVKNYKNYLVVIGTARYKEQITEHLRALGFPLELVLTVDDSAGNWAVCGKQYFDLFPSNGEEVFIDAGAYNGDTIFDFIEWNGDKKYKIYSLEPLEHMYKFINSRLIMNNIENVKVVNCAAWCRAEELEFVDRGDGSSIVKQGGFKVKGDSIDNIVGNENVTFIKMDIEGAELDALKGACETIKKYHPKLAICIYHKPSDILQLSKYILRLNPDYKLYIRHYTLTMCETVLYAIP